MTAPSGRVPGAADEALLADAFAAVAAELVPAVPRVREDTITAVTKEAIAAAGRVLEARLRAEAKVLHIGGEYRLASGVRESARRVAAWCGLPPEGAAGGGEGG